MQYIETFKALCLSSGLLRFFSTWGTEKVTGLWFAWRSVLRLTLYNEDKNSHSYAESNSWTRISQDGSNHGKKRTSLDNSNLETLVRISYHREPLSNIWKNKKDWYFFIIYLGFLCITKNIMYKSNLFLCFFYLH